MARLALIATLLVACGREATPKETIAGTARSGRTTAAAPAAKGVCPATGNWSECSVFERLDRAGLAPRLDSSVVSEAPLNARGVLLHLGAAELELYFYPDSKTRQQEESRLDRTKYVDYASPLSMRQEPTLIHSVNLIAILHSRNDHQRERVADAITAGPPQP
jgi:hypothetical protein